MCFSNGHVFKTVIRVLSQSHALACHRLTLKLLLAIYRIENA